MSDRDEITARLRADPYRVDLLIRRLLLHLCAGEGTAAREDLLALQRLGAARTLAPSLALAVDGRLAVTRRGDAFLLFDPALGPALVSWTMQCLEAARRDAERLFGSAECLPVVELSGACPGFHFTSGEVPGIGYMRVSPRTSLTELEAVIAHEVAHVCLRSGNRFLDEGIAVHFQGRDGGRIFVGSEVNIRALLAAAGPERLPLRGLLAYDGRNDLFFERLESDAARRQLVYAQGYLFAAFLYDRLGGRGLRDLCASLRLAESPAAHPRIVARHLQADIEAIELAVFGAGPSAERGLSSSGTETWPAPQDIWSLRSSGDLGRLIGRLRAVLAGGAAPAIARATLARALIRRALEAGATRAPVDIAEARSLVHDLAGEDGLPEKEHTLLEGWLAIAETRTASTAVSRIVSWERALQLVGRALTRFPDDPEVLCAGAALHLHGPEQYGANRSLARDCLASARRARGWTALADAIENGPRSRKAAPA